MLTGGQEGTAGRRDDVFRGGRSYHTDRTGAHRPTGSPEGRGESSRLSQRSVLSPFLGWGSPVRLTRAALPPWGRISAVASCNSAGGWRV